MKQHSEGIEGDDSMRWFADPRILLCTLIVAVIPRPGMGQTVAGPEPKSSGELPGIVLPIRFTMPEPNELVIAAEQQYGGNPQPIPLTQQQGYNRPVQQPYQQPYGTNSTGGYRTPVTIPQGATGEQVYQMALSANANGQKGQALSYLEKSAEMEYPKGEWAIGIDYLKGVGEPRNQQQAVHWLSMAADAGYRAGQYQMGDLYEKGEGVPQDETRAIQFYKLAAAQHSADAEFALGLDYEFAKGVPHNRQLAIQYFRESSRDGTNTIGTDMANALAKAPATTRFSSLEDMGAYLHPPHKLTAQDRARCGTEYNFMAGYGGSLTISRYCQNHFGCPYTVGATEYTCYSPPVERIYP